MFLKLSFNKQQQQQQRQTTKTKQLDLDLCGKPVHGGRSQAGKRTKTHTLGLVK